MLVTAENTLERCLETSKLRKTSKNSTLFIPVGHCGTPYSKSVIPCRRPSTVGDEKKEEARSRDSLVSRIL